MCKHFLLCLTYTCFSFLGAGQTVIYSENFDASSNMPNGWTATPATNGWTVSTSNSSTTYAGASGMNNIKIDNNFPTGTYSISTKSISTTGYSSVTVSWGARLTTNFPPSTITPSVYFSLNNGSTWAAVSYSETSSASTWALNGPVALPAVAFNQPSIMFQLVANITNAASGTYRIDDFTVKGSSVPTKLSETPSLSSNIYIFGKNLYINASSEAASVSRIALTSIEGETVYTKDVNDNTTLPIALENVTAGIYLLKIIYSDNTVAFKKICLY